MKTIIVTGANKGIGLAVVEAILQEQPEYRVLLGSRDASRGAQARDSLLDINANWSEQLQVLELDVSDEASVASAAVEVAALIKTKGGQLVALVNNAGIVSGSRANIVDVNAYGVVRTTDVFAPMLVDGGRVVNVTSASGPNYVAECSTEWQAHFNNPQLEWRQIDQFMQDYIQLADTELEAKGLPGGDYGFSKASANLCNMMLARTYPHLLINACTPGFIETDLTHEMTRGMGKSAEELGMKQPADGARVVMHLLFGEVNGSGWYFGSDSQRSPVDCYRAPGSAAYTA